MSTISKLTFFVFLGIFFQMNFCFGQTQVAITIDDVPNTKMFETNQYRSALLEQLIANSIPATIFVNEGQLYKTTYFEENLILLEEWSSAELISLGNHSYSHARYSDVGLDSFIVEIDSGEHFLRHFSENIGKPLTYFRFPFNDLGGDSLQHVHIDSVLKQRGYFSTPFTVESSDWMFNYIYAYYLSEGDSSKAREIGELYVSTTIDFFHFFDTLSLEKYGRKIDHIYLCHDNALNTDYLIPLIDRLTNEGYVLAHLDDVLKDPVYIQENNYFKKWGISWLYRWMEDQKERVNWMRKEPNITEIESLYNLLIESR